VLLPDRDRRRDTFHDLLPSHTKLAHKTMSLDRAQDRPKILFVTSHWPMAAAYGAQQRVLNIGKLLSRFGDVSFVIVSSEHEDEETVRRTKREFRVHRVIRPLLVAPGGASRQLPERLRHEFDPTYMVSDPYAVSEPDRAALQQLIQQHDVIWVHTVKIANRFRIFRWPHSVLDVDDLVSCQEQSAAQSSGNLVKRLLHLRRSWIWQRRERILRERFDVLTVCSEEDRRYLGGSERIHVIPNGAHPLEARPRPPSVLPRIGLIGNCTFPPNEEGAKWFIRDVWPMVKREFPRAQLRLVGRGSEGHLTTLGPDITGLGWLECPGEEIASWSAMIVPIKLGAGTRVKIAEGFARRCPVVATTMGAFGYDVEDGRELLLADRAGDFASACIKLLSNPELGEALSERAHKRFLERWTWDSFESTVGAAIQECLARSDRAQFARVDATS
jgi:polysaccharide biosynthesis protein PslH